MPIYVSSGVISSGVYLDSDTMIVSSGGTANKTYLDIVRVSPDATPLVCSSGSLQVENGGVAIDTVCGAYIYVSGGGRADHTTLTATTITYYFGLVTPSGPYYLNSAFFYGSMYVDSGGTANNTIVNKGTNLTVASGGTATIAFNPWLGTVHSGEGATVTYLERDAKIYIGRDGGIVSKADSTNGQTLNPWNNRAIVYSGGTAVDTLVTSEANLTVSDGGLAIGTTIEGGYVVSSYGTDTWNVQVSGVLMVSSGGTAVNTTVNSLGQLHVSAGGTANSTTVNSDGYLNISSGGTANSTTVSSGGHLHVSAAGTADNTNVKFDGNLYVSAGGTANSTTVNSGGRLNVSSGGTANEVIENGGYVNVQSGANVTFAAHTFTGVILSSASATVHSGTTANSATVNSGGILHITGGGKANNTTVNTGGKLYVSSGTATEIIENGGYVDVRDGANVTFTANSFSGLILSSASATVHSGTTANETTVNAKGYFHVFSGGKANSTTVNNWGSMYVYDGGIANSTIVNTHGELHIFSGGSATIVFDPWRGTVFSAEGATVTYLERDAGVYVGKYTSGLISKTNTISGQILETGTSVIVFSGGTANSTMVNSGGNLHISDGGKANNTTVNDGGTMYVSSGGTATDILENGGYVDVQDGANVTFTANSFSGLILSSASATVHSGTTANSTTVNYGGDLYVSSGGTANSTTISGRGHLYVYNGGTANDTEVNGYYGRLYVYSGGVANNTTINDQGRLYVYSGGTTNSTTVNDGSLSIYSGGTANNTRVNCGCELSIEEGGLANKTTVSSGGYIYVYSGGTADSATIYGNGELNVFDGGSATNARVYAGGMVKVSSGGMITGRMNFAMGTVISMEDHAVLDFDLTQASADGKAILSDWSLIQGMPDYTLTVDGTQASGRYVLAEGAEDFEGEITVRNTSGAVLGTLTVGNSLTLDNADYELILSDDVLSLQVLSGEIYRGIVVENGSRTVTKDQIYLDTVISSGGTLFVSSGGSARNTSVFEGGRVEVHSGASANSAMVFSGGSFRVSSGGSATNIVASNGAYVGFILSPETYAQGTSGGVAFDTSDAYISGYTVSSGFLTVASGGSADRITIQKDGRFRVSSGGTGTRITVEEGGYLAVIVTSDTYVQGTSNGSAFEMKDAYISGYTVNNGFLSVSSGGRADDTVVIDGELYIRNGTANGAIISSGASVSIVSGGTATSLILENGACARMWLKTGTYIQGTSNGREFGIQEAVFSNYNLIGSDYLVLYEGISATNIEVASGGTMGVLSGAFASGVTVNRDGCMVVSNGGSATAVIENGGYIDARWDNVAFLPNTFSGAVVSSRATVHEGTVAVDTVLSGGSLYLSSGGIASNTTVLDGGKVTVQSKGLANGVTINSGCSLAVNSGGTANGVTVSSGGSLYLPGKLTGRVTLEAGALVSVLSGTIIDFDVSGIAPNGAALFNDLSRLTGWNKANLTLTVPGSQSSGVYALANGAGDFDGVITVRNTSGTELGTISAGETLTTAGADYTLNLNGGALSVTVSALKPGTRDPSFFPGCFSGGEQAMLAKQTDDMVTIYFEQDTWGYGLALDSGWEIAGVGDFNGDGRDDFLRVNDEGYVVGEMTKFNGKFTTQVLNFLNEGWDILGVGDFNGNGTDDVLIANPTAASETVGLLGYWESGTTWTLINGYSAEWEMVATGDFNGDGKCDMLWKNEFVGNGGLTYNAYCTWIVDDPVDWRMVSVANPAEWNFLCSGDFDGDKMNDIAMINDVGVVGIWGVNDGYLSSWSILSAVTPEWTLAGVADFNGDGTDDIAWANSDTGLVGCWQIENKELASWQTIATLG